jgi:hypothetical protein
MCIAFARTNVNVLFEHMPDGFQYTPGGLHGDVRTAVRREPLDQFEQTTSRCRYRAMFVRDLRVDR